MMNIHSVLQEETTSRKHSPRYHEVVNAAINVIAREGLSGASIRSIANETGFTTGIVTHYFKNKEELLIAVAEAVLEPIDALLEEALLENNIFEGLIKIFVEPLQYTNKNSYWFVYAQVIANTEAEPAFAETFNSRYKNIRENIQILFLRGQQESVLRLDFSPQEACDLFCGLVDGLALHAVSEPDRFPAGYLANLVIRELERLRA